MFRVIVNYPNDKIDELYVFGNKSILTELEERNIVMNFNCRQGHCGSCIVQLLKGDVSHKDCLVPLAKGEILSCRATPVTDIVIALRVS